MVTWKAATARRAAAVMGLALLAPALAQDPAQLRRTTDEQLDVRHERFTLPNGLEVLLASDPSASGVAVWMTFRAGALDEPPRRAGLAHLVEHILATGPTPATDYAALLEQRRARHFNAATGFAHMTFEVVVPAAELPLALWTMADRLGTLPGLIDAALVERHRRVVVQERALRIVDQPYGLVYERLFGRLYEPPHPLRAGIGGAPAELAAVTPEEARAFVAQRLVPANAVLVLVGGFDPATARRLVEEGLGRLPAGRRPSTSAVPRPPPAGLEEKRSEPLSRRPMVVMGWRLSDVPMEEAAALRVGAQLLTLLTDGAWGMRLWAGLSRYGDESLFLLRLNVPYDEPPQVVQGNAESFLRQLTHKEMDAEYLATAHLALDRLELLELASLGGRAAALTDLALDGFDGLTLGQQLGWHWSVGRAAVRDVARLYLRRPRVVLHARPTRPLAARAEREQ